ncbi:MAG TPA: winged helix DNA-binding domain-containing protein [Candidatus Acidoferrales bacterium]|nr:winged helix DNA-binding domain-containing protein [Candidatus Acidoferrales bacterium]
MTAKEIVSWMGAIQAQDYSMAKWAIGIRLPDSTDELIAAAINEGEILRTHLMRPTWHFVSSDDIYWMLELTAPHIIASMKFREKWLGLTGAIIAKSNRVIEKALSPDEHLTREELIAELNKARIVTGGFRGSHLIMRAEWEGLICSGRMKGIKQTYALLEKRVAKRKHVSREDSLKELARKYFSSHGPATLHDFARWSGLSMNDSKNALEMIKSKFVSEVADGNTYWLPDSLAVPNHESIPNAPSRIGALRDMPLSPSLFGKRGGKPALRDGGESEYCWQHLRKQNSVFLLPAFDEFLVGYKDRSASLYRSIEKKLISENRLFRPAIVINGQVTGLWKRKIADGELIIETGLFRAHTKKEKDVIRQASMQFGKFLDAKNVVCRI